MEQTILCILNQIALNIKITFQKKVTGSYCVYSTITVSEWQRCREFKNLTIKKKKETGDVLYVKNSNFHFKVINCNFYNGLPL